jgi:hypothetical protein
VNEKKLAFTLTTRGAVQYRGASLSVRVPVAPAAGWFEANIHP